MGTWLFSKLGNVKGEEGEWRPTSFIQEQVGSITATSPTALPVMGQPLTSHMHYHDDWQVTLFLLTRPQPETLMISNNTWLTWAVCVRCILWSGNPWEMMQEFQTRRAALEGVSSYTRGNASWRPENDPPSLYSQEHILQGSKRACHKNCGGDGKSCQITCILEKGTPGSNY